MKSKQHCSRCEKENSYDYGTTDTTFLGAGFKDRNKALETLKILEGRDISFQLRIVKVMMNRANATLKLVKDGEKFRNIKEALMVYENWMENYSAYSRGKESFRYLSIETIEAYSPLADEYGIKTDSSNRNFLEAYKSVEGNLKRLRLLPVDKENEVVETWDICRNAHLRQLKQKMIEQHLALYRSDLQLCGLPTSEHVEMIMWGYSPEAPKVIKAIPLISEKLGILKNRNRMNVEQRL